VELTASAEEVRRRCDAARATGATIGLVPTMGDLHAGHERLIRSAARACGFVAVSIFVNPLQFDSADDLAAYPRRLDDDRAVAERLGADLLFAPPEDEVYPGGPPEVTVDPGSLGERLEGASRPGHFRGVLTVVSKLLHLARPSHAFFGEKDAQQLALVRRMADDLDEAVEIVGCPTVREPDGLALSSRNRRLSPEDRAAAPVLFEALSDAASLARGGERRGDVLRAELARRIGSEPRVALDYVAVVDDATWEDVDMMRGPSRALVAARLGPTRLIDNLLLPWAG
jgi:pantoate--beta-alanine ligase